MKKLLNKMGYTNTRGKIQTGEIFFDIVFVSGVLIFAYVGYLAYTN